MADTDATNEPRNTWFRDELEAARAFNASLPEHCRLVVVRPSEETP